MLDIRWMRENREALAEAMRKLNDTEAPWEQALALDEQRRQILTQVESLRAERNAGSKEVGKLFGQKKTEEANALKARMSEVGTEIDRLDAELRTVEEGFNAAMLRIPNIPEPDVPVAEVSMPPKGIHIAINATALGLRPGDPQAFDPMTLDPDVVVADVIMSPVETPLLKRARTHGRRIHHGRHMLDHQVPLYLDWFGIDTKGIDVIRLVRSIG